MASPKLVQFALNVQQGMDATNAARAAGYADSTARVKAGQLVEQARAEGLLPTEEQARDALAVVHDAVWGDDGEQFSKAWKVMVAQAQAGNVGAMRLIMEYLVGKPETKVDARGAIEFVYTYQGDA